MDYVIPHHEAAKDPLKYSLSVQTPPQISTNAHDASVCIHHRPVAGLSYTPPSSPLRIPRPQSYLPELGNQHVWNVEDIFLHHEPAEHGSQNPPSNHPYQLRNHPKHPQAHCTCVCMQRRPVAWVLHFPSPGFLPMLSSHPPPLSYIPECRSSALYNVESIIPPGGCRRPPQVIVTIRTPFPKDPQTPNAYGTQHSPRAWVSYPPSSSPLLPILLIRIPLSRAHGFGSRARVERGKHPSAPGGCRRRGGRLPLGDCVSDCLEYRGTFLKRDPPTCGILGTRSIIALTPPWGCLLRRDGGIFWEGAIERGGKCSEVDERGRMEMGRWRGVVCSPRCGELLVEHGFTLPPRCLSTRYNKCQLTEPVL